jgi:hypothetical protein
MPKRVISVLGSLTSVLGNRYPDSVLDIGSGTGATALALDLLEAPRCITLSGVEPSREMRLFAEASRLKRVSQHYVSGSVHDIARGSLDFDSNHLIVFSATFPYGFDEWGSLSEVPGDYQHNQHRMVLVVEPEAKSDLLDSFEQSLNANGWPTIRLCCHDLPASLKRNDLPLPRISSVVRSLGLENVISAETW